MAINVSRCLRLAAGFVRSSLAKAGRILRTRSDRRKGVNPESPRSDGTTTMVMIQKKQRAALTLKELMHNADQDAPLIADEEEEADDELANPNVTMNPGSESGKAKMGSKQGWKATTGMRSEVVCLSPKRRRRVRSNDNDQAGAAVYLNVYDLAPKINGSKQGWKGITGMRSEVRCLSPKRRRRVRSNGDQAAAVYLNVYDLAPTINGYVYWAGLGIFHSGVEVHGVEYAYGKHDEPTSGVFEVKPRQCPGYKFKRSIFVGTTTLSPKQVRLFMERQVAAGSFYGDTYDLILNNCNHFSNSVCHKLTGRQIPKWVNRLARIGKTLIPGSLKIAPAVGRNPYVRHQQPLAREEVVEGNAEIHPSADCLFQCSP